MYSCVPLQTSVYDIDNFTKEEIFAMLSKSHAVGAYYGYIDMTGKIVISQQYSNVTPFCEGLAAVQLTSGRCGYIDKTGKTVIEFKFDAAGSFSDGLACVANDAGKYGYIDKTGSVVVPMVYDDAFGAGDGICSVGRIVDTESDIYGTLKQIYKYGFTDAMGNVVIPLEYDDVSYFSNGVAYGIKDGRVYIFQLKPAMLETPSPWAIDSVVEAVSAGIVPDVLQSKYTQNITRAEFCSLAVALYETTTGMTITERMQFSDTNDVNVEKMAALGVANGIGDGKFGPEGKLSREQAATMLSRLAAVIGKPLPEQKTTFTDALNISSWSIGAVGQMQATGIMGGVGNNIFAPKGDYTREQSMITILRLYQFLNQ